MAEFIRVRAADGPKHEYDAPVSEVEANPDLYVVIDSTPVYAPRPVDYHAPAKRAPKPSLGETNKEKS